MNELNQGELEKFLNNLWTNFERMIERIIVQHEAKGYHEKASEVMKQLEKDQQAYQQIKEMIKKSSDIKR